MFNVPPYSVVKEDHDTSLEHSIVKYSIIQNVPETVIHLKVL